MGMLEDLDDFVVPEDEQAWDSLVLASVPEATRVARRLLIESKRLAEIRAEADVERRRIDRMEADRSAGAEYLIGKLKGKLEGWMHTLLDVARETGEDIGKTQALLGVKVKANPRGGLGGKTIRDREAVLAWAVENDALDGDTPIAIAFDTLVHVERLLRDHAALVRSGDCASPDEPTGALAEHLANHITQACNAGVKIKLPSGWKAKNRRAMERGEETTLINPATGEELPGVVVPPVEHTVVVTVVDE